MRFLLAILLLLFALPAQAQNMQRAVVVSSCGAQALPQGPLTNLTMNPQGRLCLNGISTGPPTLPPANSVAPVASGTATVGSALSCSTGVWTNSPASFAYQWKRGASNISGATSSTYTTVSADGGQSLTCVVTATNVIGSTPATSNALAILGVPANSVAPVASGSLTVGSTLSCTTGTWSNSPTSYAYTWLRGGTPISGATSASYVTVTADGGTSVGCAVVATNASGNSTSVASNTLAIVGSGCTAATNYLARTTGGNEGGNATNITALICGLVTDGVITGNLSGARACGTFLDTFYVLAQQNRADSLLNVCGTSYSLVDNSAGNLTFTAYAGWSGFNGNSAWYLDTVFNATTATTPNFTQNSASFGIWSYAVISSTAAQIGNNASGASGESHIYDDYSGTTFYTRVNNASVGGVPLPGTKGLFVGDRISSSTVSPYWDGVNQGDQASPSQAPFNGNFHVGSAPGGPAPTAQILCEAHIGGSLGSTLELALYTRLRTYMTAVGVSLLDNPRPREDP